MAEIGGARTVALELVRRVADEGAYSNLLLPALLRRSGLSARDRGLATEIGYGPLRRLLPIDERLAELVERPIDRAAPLARAALRVGAYQLLYMRVPAHAAVGETVELVPSAQRGFVNAVLRKLSRAEPAREGGDGDGAVATR